MDDIAKIAAGLSPVECEELDALAKANAAINGPSFIMRLHWPLYRKMVRGGLVKWGDPPGSFTKKRWAGIEITQLGRSVLAHIGESQ